MTETTWLDDKKEYEKALLSVSKNIKKNKSQHRDRTDRVSDVAIIGGGLTGILAAYLLAEENKRVIICEKNKIGEGVTSLTTAFLTESIDTDFADLIQDFGLKNARDIIASHHKAIDLIEHIVKKHKIDCEFIRCSNYIYANSPDEAKGLSKEFDAFMRLGGNAKLSHNGMDLSIPNNGFIEIKDQAKFHPLKFIQGVVKVLVDLGVQIEEKSEVENVGPAKSKNKIQIQTIDGKEEASLIQIDLKKGESVLCHYAIVATYEAFNNPLKLYFEKGTYTTYIMELKIKGSVLPEATYEDMANPYHYLRVDKQEGFDRVIVGGEDHRSDIHVDARRNFNALKEYADRILGRENYTIVRKWSGPILEPVDGLAAIGSLRRQKNILYATGFSGNGMTYAGIAAIVIRDTISGKKNPWAHIYNAKRTPKLKALITKGKDYTSELIHGALQNTFTEKKDYLSQKLFNNTKK